MVHYIPEPIPNTSSGILIIWQQQTFSVTPARFLAIKWLQGNTLDSEARVFYSKKPLEGETACACYELLPQKTSGLPRGTKGKGGCIK